MPIPINLAVEDAISEAVVRRLLVESGRGYMTATIYNRGGNGYLRTTIRGFNNAAKGVPFLVLTDLDRYDCAPSLLNDWLEVPRHDNLLLRVAVREVEAWLLADRQGFADFIGIRIDLVPQNIEAIIDPKKELVRLAGRSPYRDVRRDICPPVDSTRIVGPGYNASLTNFVMSAWNPGDAGANSRSLQKAIECLARFTPRWPRID